MLHKTLLPSKKYYLLWASTFVCTSVWLNLLGTLHYGEKFFILSGWGMHVTFDPSELAYLHTVDVLAHTIPFTPVNRG